MWINVFESSKLFCFQILLLCRLSPFCMVFQLHICLTFILYLLYLFYSFCISYSFVCLVCIFSSDLSFDEFFSSVSNMLMKRFAFISQFWSFIWLLKIIFMFPSKLSVLSFISLSIWGIVILISSSENFM